MPSEPRLAEDRRRRFIPERLESTKKASAGWFSLSEWVRREIDQALCAVVA